MGQFSVELGWWEVLPHPIHPSIDKEWRWDLFLSELILHCGGRAHEGEEECLMVFPLPKTKATSAMVPYSTRLERREDKSDKKRVKSWPLAKLLKLKFQTKFMSYLHYLIKVVHEKINVAVLAGGRCFPQYCICQSLISHHCFWAMLIAVVMWRFF